MTIPPDILNYSPGFIFISCPIIFNLLFKSFVFKHVCVCIVIKHVLFCNQKNIKISSGKAVGRVSTYIPASNLVSAA